MEENVTKVLSRLRQLGLNQYEAQTYLSLASVGSASPGDLAEIAEIPRPRIYDVLARLEKKGFVGLQPGRPVRYTAAPLHEALSNLKKQKEKELESDLAQLERLGTELHEHINSMKSPGKDDFGDVFVLRGKHALETKTNSMISSAEKRVFVATTALGLQRKLAAHRDVFRNVAGNGIKLDFVVPEDAKDYINEIANIANIRHANVENRFLVKDGNESLVFLTPDNVGAKEETGLWIKNPSFASMLERVHR